jgi:hypothetical protein
VLVIDGRAKVLTKLPASESHQNQVTISGRLKSIEGNDWRAELDAVGTGYGDYQLRDLAQAAPGQTGGMALLAARFRPTTGSYALETQRATVVSDLQRDFSWHGEGTCLGLSTVHDGKCVLHAPFWIPKEWDLALSRRTAPLFLNEGFAWTLEERFEVAVPADLQAVSFPAMDENRDGPLRWSVRWEKNGDGGVAACLRVELAQAELTLSETARFQQQLRRLLSALGSDVVLPEQALAHPDFTASQN